MIKLYTFGPAFGLPDPSPFITKVDLYMKMAGIEFEAIPGVNNLQKAPKAKLPYINDNGKDIADSTFIIQHLKQNHAADLDAWLTPEQAATAQLIGKSLDENLYWTIVYSRWVKDDVWPIISKEFFGGLPFPLNKIVAKLARSSTIKHFNGHGMGKHSNDEIINIAETSLKSLSTLLGDKPYFFGDKPSSLDPNAYAIISGCTHCELHTELKEMATKYDNLVNYVQRLTQQYYPDFA